MGGEKDPRGPLASVTSRQAPYFCSLCETGKTKLRACGNLVHLTHYRRVFQNATVNLGETAVQNRSLRMSHHPQCRPLQPAGRPALGACKARAARNPACPHQETPPAAWGPTLRLALGGETNSSPLESRPPRWPGLSRLALQSQALCPAPASVPPKQRRLCCPRFHRIFVSACYRFPGVTF